MSKSDYARQKLSLVNERIALACDKSGRDRSSITLIGASKKQTPALIESFVNAGLGDLGENYLQEAIAKQATINPDIKSNSIKWHFIGQIQSNKTNAIAQHFNWVHGVDRIKIAKRLGNQHQHSAPINLLIQLNPDQEGSKGGVLLEKAAETADQIAGLDGVKLQGFMMIPKARETFDDQCQVFATAKATLDQTNQRYGLQLKHLSMGMSGDLEAAIHQGSTMVRIGTDLFGARD